MDCCRVSLLLDKLTRDWEPGPHRRGRELLTSLLDHVLPECCSPEMLEAFAQAVQQDAAVRARKS